MNKEEARKELKKAESSLRVAEIVSEEHKKAIKEIKEDIEKLKAIINKKDNWRDKLAQADTTVHYFIERDKYQGFIVEEGYFSPRKPEHVFNTVPQAELIMNKMLLMQEMYAFAHVKNEGWIPDWGDCETKKWGLITDTVEGIYLYSYFNFNPFIFGIAVKSEEIAQEMLEEFGDRINKIYNKQY